MNYSTIERFLWIIQFAGFCIAATENAIVHPAYTDDCPCRPFDECDSKSESFLGNTQAPMLYCESENLIRCCTMIPETLGDPAVDASSTGVDEVKESETNVESIEELIEFMKNRMLDLLNGHEESQQQPVIETATLLPSVKQSSPEENLSSINIESSESEDGMKLSYVENNEANEPSTTQTYIERVHANIFENVKDVMAFMETNHQLEYLKEEPQATRARMLNNFRLEAEAPSDRGKQENVKGSRSTKFEESNDEEEFHLQQLIRNQMSFESLKISPKRQFPHNHRFDNIRMLKRQDDFILSPTFVGRRTGRANLLPFGETALSEYERSNENSGLTSSSKSIPAKMTDFFEQKTSLETLLTLDQVSVQATNENTSNLTSNLGVALGNDDTSIRNLSSPENIKGIKRLVRSRGLEIAEESRKPMNESTVPRKRFKIPPRMLPVRVVQNEKRNDQAGSNKFVNSKQRTLDLFNRSNEKRRKHVSFIINRSDPKISKIAPINSDSSGE